MKGKEDICAQTAVFFGWRGSRDSQGKEYHVTADVKMIMSHEICPSRGGLIFESNSNMANDPQNVSGSSTKQTCVMKKAWSFIALKKNYYK